MTANCGYCGSTLLSMKVVDRGWNAKDERAVQDVCDVCIACGHENFYSTDEEWLATKKMYITTIAGEHGTLNAS